MKEKKLVEKLSKLNASNIVFKDNWISLDYDGRHLKDRVIKRRINLIGNWSRKNNVVYYDPDLKKEYVVPILVHEVVEKYVTEKYGLNADKESHEVADAVEREFVGEKNWRSHQQRMIKILRCKNHK